MGLVVVGWGVRVVDAAPRFKKVPVRLIAPSLYAATTPRGATLSGEQQIKPLILYQAWPTRPVIMSGIWSMKIGFYILAVRPDGSVSNVEILQSTGHPRIDADTVQSFMKWRFRPGSVKEVRVPVVWEKEKFLRKLNGLSVSA